MIAIIDYDAGNLASVQKACQHLGAEVTATRDKQTILQADKIILPGVGAFGDAMGKLEQFELVSVIGEAVENQTPFLGICVGLQLLFESSEESPGVNGLGILQGKIKKIPSVDGLKIPHMGWNQIEIHPGSRLFQGIESGAYVYFVHSYYLEAAHEADVAATASYGTQIHAAVEHGNVFASQFHLEKSGQLGLRILNNFLSKT